MICSWYLTKMLFKMQQITTFNLLMSSWKCTTTIFSWDIARLIYTNIKTHVTLSIRSKGDRKTTTKNDPRMPWTLCKSHFHLSTSFYIKGFHMKVHLTGMRFFYWLFLLMCTIWWSVRTPCARKTRSCIREQQPFRKSSDNCQKHGTIWTILRKLTMRSWLQAFSCFGVLLIRFWCYSSHVIYTYCSFTTLRLVTMELWRIIRTQGPVVQEANGKH